MKHLFVPVNGQIPSAPVPHTAAGQPNWTPPKTPWGDPDLQGQWPANASIPLQRPGNLGDKAAFTDLELAQKENQAQNQAQSDSEEFGKGGAVQVNPLSYWQERGRPNRHYTIYEYACHEGNYMMRDALANARDAEKQTPAAHPQQ